MGSKGEVALAFAGLVYQMRQGDMVYLTPQGFRVRAFAWSFAARTNPILIRNLYACMRHNSRALINTIQKNS